MDLKGLHSLNPPDQPGVYLMRDANRKIIYIGKAVSLKKRLASYFRPADQLDPKTQALAEKIADIEIIVTDSEIEALILECTLIKKHRPRYNILMRDDKSYPYLKLTVQEDFPRLLMTRKPFADDAGYFGPFLSSGLKELAKVISIHYGLRICKLELKAGAKLARPCLYAQMGQCDAVCMGEKGPGLYRRRVKAVLAFLNGEKDTLTPRLEVRMRKAASLNNFELAGKLRDQINAVREIQKKPLLASTGREDRDVLGLARSGTSATVEILTIRVGNLEGRRHYFIQHVGGEQDAELLSQVITQYYSSAAPVPSEILVPWHPDDEAVIQEWVNKLHNGPVRLAVPENSQEERLLKMAETNAWLFLKHSASAVGHELSEQDRQALSELASKLNLNSLPVRVEAYDISNISGTDPVGSQVVFINGQPEKTQYRHYKIRSVEGPNDFAMLQEMLYRRFKRLQDEGGGAPELIVVDGGAGQLSAARAVLRELNLLHFPVVGLAKQHEEIFLPDQPDPVRLPENGQALKFITRLRDEAHRFAISYHRKLRSKRMRYSVLNTVPGVGPAKRRLLLRTFGSVESILQVPEEELAQVPGIGPDLAKKIREVLTKGTRLSKYLMEKEENQE